MTEITVYDKNGNSIDNLVQWDTGVVIYISERYITSAQKVHFFTPESEEAYVMNSSYSNGKLSVAIPEILLRQYYPICGYIYIEDANEKKSVYGFKIRMRRRPQPSNVVLENTKDWVNIEEVLTECKSWAVGGTNSRQGEDTDNAKYYSQLSKSYAHGNSTTNRANENTDNAKYYSEQSSKSATNAKTSETNAKKSETNASTSATNAKTSETNAKKSETNAKTSETNAKASETKSQSYAVGGTNSRTGENTDNAKYYCEKAKQSLSRLANALVPMGTITFSELSGKLSSAAIGDYYNISDAFTSNSTFKDGADVKYPAGTGVYKTADGYWDCMPGIYTPEAIGAWRSGTALETTGITLKGNVAVNADASYNIGSSDKRLNYIYGNYVYGEVVRGGSIELNGGIYIRESKPREEITIGFEEVRNDEYRSYIHLGSKSNIIHNGIGYPAQIRMHSGAITDGTIIIQPKRDSKSSTITLPNHTGTLVTNVDLGKSIIPSADDSYSLGNDNYFYSNIYTNRLEIKNTSVITGDSEKTITLPNHTATLATTDLILLGEGKIRNALGNTIRLSGYLTVSDLTSWSYKLYIIVLSPYEDFRLSTTTTIPASMFELNRWFNISYNNANNGQLNVGGDTTKMYANFDAIFKRNSDTQVYFDIAKSDDAFNDSVGMWARMYAYL